MSIGLKRGTVAVEPHSMEWDLNAREMINKLKNKLKNDIVEAQHIGSTSIKNICAKPIIDIVVGVNSHGDYRKKGYAAGCFVNNHITRVYVLSEYQKKGYGIFIMKNIEAMISEKYDKAYFDASFYYGG